MLINRTRTIKGEPLLNSPKPRTRTPTHDGHTPVFVLLLTAVMCLAFTGLALAQADTVFSYDLGDVNIIQDQFAPDSRFYTMPVRLQGVLAVPEGEGPFPVAVIVHGSYEFCTALGGEADVYPCPPEDDLHQYQGFSYLAGSLASRGYLTIVPDISAEYNNGFGEPIFAQRAIQIIEAHLSAMLNDDIVSEAATKADMDRLVVVSHSRGGPLAVSYINDDTYAMHEVSALAMLTPAFLYPGMTIPENLPTALVISECDGDVGTEQPLSYLTEQLLPLRPAITTIVTVPGGTHNAFSTQLDADPRAVCEAAEIMDPQAQREFASQFLPDYLDMALDSAT